MGNPQQIDPLQRESRERVFFVGGEGLDDCVGAGIHRQLCIASYYTDAKRASEWTFRHLKRSPE